MKCQCKLGLLGIEPIFNKKGAIQKIGGFHLDYMNTLEKSGALEFSEKVMYDHGFYSARLLYKGNIAKPLATFFPAHWTREQVIDAIFEAYDNFIKHGAIPTILEKGKYTIEGINSIGNSIEMIITPTGKIITAYPIL